MPGNSKSKRGANLKRLNEAHPRTDAKRRREWLVASDDEKDADFDERADVSSSDDEMSDDEMDCGSPRLFTPALQLRGRQLAASQKRSRKRASSAPGADLRGFFASLSTPIARVEAPAGTPQTAVTTDLQPADPPADLPADPPADSPAQSPALPPVQLPTSSTLPAELDECSICLEALEASATGLMHPCPLPCAHVFHGGCIIRWSRSSGHNAKRCPTCRAEDPGEASSSLDPPPEKEVDGVDAKVALMLQTMAGADVSLATTEVVAIATEAVRSGYTKYGKKIGRPPGTKTTLSRTERFASHGGRSTKALGSSSMESKSVRSAVDRSRRARSADPPNTAVANPPDPPAPEPKRRKDADRQRGPQPLTTMPDSMKAAITRIHYKGRFERSDVVGGEEMAATTWLELRSNRWELRRMAVMAAWVTARKTMGVVEAAERVVVGNVLGPHAKPLDSSTLQRWLSDFVKARGRITPSERGHHSKTESFLDDEDIKQTAKQWLRENVQAARKKPIPGEHPPPPLNVLRFHRYANETLLKDIINPLPNLMGPVKPRKPITDRTACRWLHALGFNYTPNKKMIYFDGHERADVVQDCIEKAVMLEVLKEVGTWHMYGGWS